MRIEQEEQAKLKALNEAKAALEAALIEEQKKAAKAKAKAEEQRRAAKEQEKEEGLSTDTEDSEAKKPTRSIKKKSSFRKKNKE